MMIEPKVIPLSVTVAVALPTVVDDLDQLHADLANFPGFTGLRSQGANLTAVFTEGTIPPSADELGRRIAAHKPSPPAVLPASPMETFASASRPTADQTVGAVKDLILQLEARGLISLRKGLRDAGSATAVR